MIAESIKNMNDKKTMFDDADVEFTPAVSGDKMNKNLETRVGYVALSMIRDELREYIAAYTENGLYRGDLHYYLQAEKIEEYLRIE